MKHRLTMLVGTAAFFAVLLVPTTALAGGPGGEMCKIAGSATITPPLKTAPAPGKVAFTGKLTSCHGSNSKITSGKVLGSASGTGDCAEGNDTLKATITWSNGSKSSVSAHLLSVTGLANVIGSVTSGAFKGSPFGSEVVFQPSGGPAGAAACGGAGIKKVTYQGFTF